VFLLSVSMISRTSCKAEGCLGPRNTDGGPLTSASPNETVEKVQFSYFLEKTVFEFPWLMSGDFLVLGFFDSLNYGVRATAASLRIERTSPAGAAAHSAR
jgi:hypothetical protein